MKPNSIYSMHPGFAMVESSMRLLHERTGKSKEEWVEILRRHGPPSEREQREWLKAEHGFTTNYAMWISEEAAGRGIDSYDPDALVEEQYVGAKQALLPLYETLLHLGLSLGRDVKACPGVTAVPLIRRHVFAQIKATTQARIDLGFCLRGIAATPRLISTGGEAKGDRITHRVAISSPADIDDEVRAWYRQAYEADR